MNHASASRSLLEQVHFASLATLQEGHPFASLVEVASDTQGQPLLLISDLAEHTLNLRQDPRCSLLVCPQLDLAEGRCTLVGRAQLASEGTERFLQKHPKAAQYATFKDFNLWRIEVEKVRYVGGFGAMSWIEGEHYRQDPIAEIAPGAISHMNEDHADALLLLAQKASSQPVLKAEMVACDFLGYEVRVNDQHNLRLQFAQPILEADSLRKEFVRQVREARG